MTKNLSLASATVVLVLSLGALAQQNSRSGAVRVQNPDPLTTGRKAVMLTGRVGDDGKVLVSEDQDQWAVSNPSVLAAHAGHLVTVKCQLSADQNSIHVLSVKTAETRYVASDAAYRRQSLLFPAGCRSTPLGRLAVSLWFP